MWIFFFFWSITQLFVSAFLNLKTYTVPLEERIGDPFWSVTRLRLELFMVQTWIGLSHRTAHSKNETPGKLQIGKQSKSGKRCTGQAKKHYSNFMVPKKHLLKILQLRGCTECKEKTKLLTPFSVSPASKNLPWAQASASGWSAKRVSLSSSS